ncbi:MAG TPA: hypothetical protein VN867_02715 [Candidatus Binataceae bacterium]|nr:hypothetical protein [Candidatus Binataceae bacterium]
MILTLAILIGSSPLIAGIVITPGPSRPEISANICHPIQTFNLVANILLARPAGAMPKSDLHDQGTVFAKVEPRPIDYRVAPDTPPPKLPIS